MVRYCSLDIIGPEQFSGPPQIASNGRGPLRQLTEAPPWGMLSKGRHGRDGSCEFSGIRMRLQKIFFRETIDGSESWAVDATNLDQINLLVGLNASGKTMTLNVIGSLAGVISGRLTPPLPGGFYEAIFADDRRDGPATKYTLKIHQGQIHREHLAIGKEVVLTRQKTGTGKLRAERVKEMLEFRVPRNQVAVLGKRDSLQHPFLEELHRWAARLLHFRCAGDMGKSRYLVIGPNLTNYSDATQSADDPAKTFHTGKQRHKEKYVHSIIRDMKVLDYQIQAIELAPPTSIAVGDVRGPAVWLVVREKGLEGPTDQLKMSEGMFRVLALLIQVNYALLDDPHRCVLIDDVGEGLDHERAVALVNLLRQKVADTPMQLIMATNNRFVMNHVPLSEWHILRREPNQAVVYDYHNSRAAFEEFETTGLSNFDFFRSGNFAE